MSTAKKTVKTAGIIMIITLMSKILGFGREVVIGSRFGTTHMVDAYNMAQNIPMVLFAAIGVAIATTVIPIFSEYLTKEGKDKAYDFVNNLLSIMLLITVCFTIVGIGVSPYIVRLMAPGFEGNVFLLTVRLTMILFPVTILIAISNILTASLQSMEHFTAPAMIGIPYNIIIIGTVIIFSSRFGILGVAVATVIATLTQVLIQLPILYKLGFKFRFKVNFKDEAVKRVIILSIPVLIGTGMQVINTYVDRMIASYLPEGSISALNYANRLNGFALGIFSTAIVTVIYPSLSRSSALNNTKSFLRWLNFSIKAIIYVMLPVTVCAIVLRVPIIRLLFERGAFDERSTYLTSIGLMFFSIGITASGLRDVLSRGFYSLKDTKTPMYNGGIAVIINIILNLILVRYMQLGGLALSTSVAAIVTTFMLFISLRRKIGKIGGKEIINTFIKASSASFLMGIMIYYLFRELSKVMPDGKLYEAINLFGTIVAGVALYSLIILICDRTALRYLKVGLKYINSKLAGN
ncbi:MAG: murein biosynthesis integral membrane protein MurJ [Thermoanaerobacteraceae bacterium]|nr:murein biosynthesis integral membrane protein MurJ [Thermoanaerobacteraceae bacterium]